MQWQWRKPHKGTRRFLDRALPPSPTGGRARVNRGRRCVRGRSPRLRQHKREHTSVPVRVPESRARPLALGGRRMKGKLFAKLWQRTRVFRICRGDSEHGTPPGRRHAIVRYEIAHVRCNIRKNTPSNIRKTRVSRHESWKTFLADRQERNPAADGPATTKDSESAASQRACHRPQQVRGQSTFSRVLPCSAAKNVKELQRLANDFHAGIERSVRDDYRGERQMEGL